MTMIRTFNIMSGTRVITGIILCIRVVCPPFARVLEKKQKETPSVPNRIPTPYSVSDQFT